MSRTLLFMIILIGFIGCHSDKTVPLFNGAEAIEYNKIKADHEPPIYKWGYINKIGELAIPDKYDDLREFNEGKAAYNIGGFWGYLNQDGSTFLEARYRTVEQYSEGIAIVQNLNNSYLLINNTGKIITDSMSYDKINKFKSERALVYHKSRYGYIDTLGEIIIGIDYESATDFSDGMAIVSKNGFQGIIDVHGEFIINPEYDKLWLPKSGKIRFMKDGLYGFLDEATGKSSPKRYAGATDYYEMYAVTNDGDKYLLIDKNGKTTTLPYALVDVGGEGKWMYAADTRFGFLNNDGSVLCPPNYDLVMRYREGRSGFAINDAWGYLDENGEIIIPPKYPLVWDFVNGYARMIGSTGFGFISRDGVDILPSRYMEVRDFSEGLARIQVYR